MNYTERCIELHGDKAYLCSSLNEEDVLSQIRNAIKNAFEANVERSLIEICIQNVFDEYDTQRKNTQSKSNCIYVL